MVQGIVCALLHTHAHPPTQVCSETRAPAGGGLIFHPAQAFLPYLMSLRSGSEVVQSFLPLILGSWVKGKGQGRVGQEGAQDSEEKFQVLDLERGWQMEGRGHGSMCQLSLTREAETGLERWRWLPMVSCQTSPL